MGAELTGRAGPARLLFRARIGGDQGRSFWWMSVVGLSYVAVVVWPCAPSVPTWLEVFIVGGCWILQMLLLGLPMRSCEFYPFCLRNVPHKLTCACGTKLPPQVETP